MGYNMAMEVQSFIAGDDWQERSDLTLKSVLNSGTGARMSWQPFPTHTAQQLLREQMI